MSNKSQRKGRSGERDLARELREYGYNTEAARPLNFGTIPDVIGLKGIHCEIKRVERLNVHEAMRQAIGDSEKFNDGLPTLFHRRNREPWLVTMRLDDWIQLYREWEAGNED